MYHVLIEAAGIRQIRRLQPDRYQSLRSELNATLSDGGFVPTAAEGDLMSFAQDVGLDLQPAAVVHLGAAVHRTLSDRVEDLIDFSLIIDFCAAPGNGALPSTERLLRHARSRNAWYVTETVRAAVEPYIESAVEGALYRVVGFHGAEAGERAGYYESVGDRDLTGRIERCLPAHRQVHLWITARDVSRAVASLHTASLPHARSRVLCRPDQELEDVLQAVVAGLPEPRPAARAANPVEHRAWAMGILRERFAQPASQLLSEGWRSGELNLLLSRTLDEHDPAESPLLLELVDLDRSQRAVRDRVTEALALMPLSVVVVASSSAPPGWESLEADAGPMVAAGPAGHATSVSAPASEPERYAAAYRYWRGAGLEAARLPEHHRRVMYLLALFAGTLDAASLDEFFPAIGVSLAERARILNELQDYGIISGDWTLQVNPALERRVDTLLDYDARHAIDTTIVSLLQQHLDSGALKLSPSLWTFLGRLIEGSPRVERRHALLHALAGGAAFTAFDRVLAGSANGSSISRISEASARIRLFLRDSRGPAHCQQDVAVLEPAGDRSDLSARMRGDVLLSLGEYYLADRRYRDALSAAKRATILHQQAPEQDVGACHLLMARVLMVEHRLGEAGQYLGFAREESPHDPATRLIAQTLEAIRLFLVGNLSRAGTQLDDLVEPLLRTGFSEWLILVWFTQGRIEFELGEYRQAAAQFQMTADWAEQCGMDVPARTVGAWQKRAELLAGDLRGADLLAAGSRAEDLLFAAEVHIREQQHAVALDLLDRAEELERSVDRWPRLGVCWDNGFAPLEDLMIADRDGTSELLRIIRAFRAWMLALTGRQEEAVPLFYGLTRGAEGISVDPYAGLYNFLYSSILPRERSSDRDDRATVLGKSVKLVQERMSRMDDYRDKTRYLQSNAWNRQVMEAARQHNLM